MFSAKPMFTSLFDTEDTPVDDNNDDLDIDKLDELEATL
jgi:hypothetical protein